MGKIQGLCRSEFSSLSLLAMKVQVSLGGRNCYLTFGHKNDTTKKKLEVEQEKFLSSLFVVTKLDFVMYDHIMFCEALNNQISKFFMYIQNRLMMQKLSIFNKKNGCFLYNQIELKKFCCFLR